MGPHGWYLLSPNDKGRPILPFYGHFFLNAHMARWAGPRASLVRSISCKCLVVPFNCAYSLFVLCIPQSHESLPNASCATFVVLTSRGKHIEEDMCYHRLKGEDTFGPHRREALFYITIKI